MIVEELFASLGLNVDKASFDHGGKLLKVVAAGLTGVAAAFGVHKIHQMIEGVIDLGDAASNTAQAVGMTAEQLQQYQYIGKIANVSSEEMQMGLMYLSRGMEELRLRGTGPAADALKDLGLQFKQLDGKSVDEQIQIVADAFAKMPDGSKKTAAAMELFSRSGARIIPFLNTGAEGIRKLKKEAIDLGFVIGGKDADAMNDFRDQGDRLGATWQGIKNQIVVALLPAMRELIDRILAWTKANRDVIKSGIEGAIAALSVSLKGLGVILSTAINVFAYFSNNADAAAAALVTLGIVVTAFAVKAAAAWVMALGPIDLIILAVAAIGAGIVLLIRNWDDVKRVTIDTWDAIYDKVSGFVNFVLDIPDKIWQAMVGVGHAIEKALGDAFDFVKRKALDVLDDIENLPGIKQILSVERSIADGGDHATATLGHLSDRLTPRTETSTSLHASFGDVKVDVHGTQGMDEAKLGDMVGKKVAEHQGTMLKQAYDSMRGGRR